MKFLFSALGSAGDVHPFIAIGAVLRARGHDVCILASPPFEARVRRADLAFAPLGTADDYERVLQRPELWNPRGGARLILDELLQRLPEGHAATDRHAHDPGVVLVGSTLSWGVRLVQERRGLAAATIHLSPVCLQSATEPAVLPGIGDLSWMPTWLLRAVQWAGERVVLDRLIGPRLNAFRASLGLAPVRHIWSRWMHSPDLVIGAWPSWFAAAQPDWPPATIVSGFPLFGEEGAVLPASLVDFLSAGSPPVAITPGSAMAHGEAFLARALAACDAVGVRVVVITPYRAQLPARLAEDVHVVDYAPFGLLLPRLSALIHHGGIGTSAQALAAGVPQIVVPFAHDQFDNAARLQRLGVARTLRVADGDVRWADALGAALHDPAMAAAVRTLRDRMAASGSAAETIASRLEALGVKGS